MASTPDSRLIDVSMTDSDPNSCKVIVQSVVDQYIKDEQEKNRDRQYSLNQDLEQQRITQEDKVKLIDGDIADLQADLNTAGLTGTMNKISIKDMELEELLKDLQGTTLEWQAATQQYNALNAQIEADPDQVPAVEEQVDKDPKVMQLRQIQNNIDMSLAQDAGGTMLSDSPTLQSAQKNKSMIDQRLANAEAQARSRYKTEIVEEMSERVDGLKNQAAAMQNRIATITAETQQATEHMEQLNLKQAERAADQTKLDKIDDQLDQIAAYNAKHDVAGVEWASQPELPDIPSFPKLGITMTASVTLGLMVALGIAFLRELLDTSIRSPRDISRVGSFNLLGMVPHEDDDPQSAGARLPVVIFEAPHSMMAEQLRQVRTRLQHSSSLDTSRSILVTSPSPGDGKSTIACNLASGLALRPAHPAGGRQFPPPGIASCIQSRQRTGIFRRPEQHGAFRACGAGNTGPESFVLPSGHKPPMPPNWSKASCSSISSNLAGGIRSRDLRQRPAAVCV